MPQVAKKFEKVKKSRFFGQFLNPDAPQKVPAQPLETKIWQTELSNEHEIVLKQLS